MFSEIQNAQGTELLFWICALGGSLFFTLRVGLSLIGLDLHHDHAVDSAGVSDIPHDAHGTLDAYKILSLYSIAAFLMMFGWFGLAFYKQFDLGLPISMLGATLIGVATMYAVALFFNAIGKLTSSGSVFKIETTIGRTAKVYQQVPSGGGRGVVNLTVDGILRELEAVSQEERPIESFEDVIIERIVDEKTVFVKRVSA